MPHPTRVIAADWSGAVRGQRRGLWVATADVATGRLVDLGPASREQAVTRILTAAETDPRLIVGLDFSFSMPEWWLDRCRIGAALELWSDRVRLEEWLLACPEPFWGRPGRPRPAAPGGPALRVTEQVCAAGSPAVRPPRSVFQIGGAGAVGTASLRGMPALARLHHAGFSVWPFDDWALPAVVEVWPRLALGPLVKSSADARDAWVRAHTAPVGRSAAVVRASADALDAAAAALALAGRARDRRPSLTDPVIRREGWIDGVTGPVPAALPGQGQWTDARDR